MIQHKPEVIIYTDGACSGNPGPGGWGALMMYQKIEKRLFGYELETTNNRMEMMAAIMALQALKKPCKIFFYTDSKYLQQGVTEWMPNWQKNNWLKSNNEPVKNSELWMILHEEIQKHDIIWSWVKGHANNIGNNIADSLAVQGRDQALEMRRGRDVSK
jgi:ribonuclease HI